MSEQVIQGFDASHWQEPAKWDWPALQAHHGRLRAEKGTGLIFVARATYGANTQDGAFVQYAELVRKHGLVFGAYHFYRQVHTVEDQLAAWNRQMDPDKPLHPIEPEELAQGFEALREGLHQATLGAHQLYRASGGTAESKE